MELSNGETMRKRLDVDVALWEEEGASFAIFRL